jgi:DNA-binding CsgD family transcriptional regulator
MLVGRDSERRLIDSLLADAREGRSAVLVVRGEAGIGKTALLAAAAPPDMRVLRCTGVESEHDLPFAALQRLLRPLRELVDRLAPPQAAALRSTFGLDADPVDDRLLVGLATLNLLAEAAESEPIVCLVDDLQWVDAPSSQALLFAARRLDAEGILMLFAVRTDPADWLEAPDLPQLTIGRLSDDEARRMLRGRALSAHAMDEVLREAAGNPLALLELPADGAPGSAGLEGTFRARVLRLPEETRRLLLLAASADGDEERTWDEVAALAGAPPDARLPAVGDGLVADSSVASFRHPLVRSAVRSAASRAEQSEAHRLLAAAAGDALARASHLAAAADGPDEPVATDLEEAAGSAARRAAFASAADALARAAELSVDPRSRTRRLTLAAQACLHAGNADRAAALVDGALPGATTDAERAALAAVRGMLEMQRGSPERAFELFSEAAWSVAANDPALSLELEGGAITAAFVAGWPERAFAHAHTLVGALPETGTPEDRFLRTFLDGMAALANGVREDARARLTEAVRVGEEVGDVRYVIWAGIATVYLGDMPSAREHYARALATVRASGSFSLLPGALLARGRLDVTLRAIAEAEECAREGLDLTRQLGQENQETAFSGILVRVLAFRGEVDACRDLAEETLRRAHAHGLGVAIADAYLGLAELELALGNGAEARALIEQVPHPLARLFATASLLDASLAAGDPAPARAAVDALAAYAEQGGDPYFLGIVARCRAQLEPDLEAADALYREALARQSGHVPAFERARTELAYGEFLRRAQRRNDARVQLRSALATLEGLGARPWADRARAELEATGITARKRDPSTLDALTPQELRIARLVAAGASNRDVAAQLFLSPKTVEYHLRKVFLKIGVSSRVALARLPFD